MAWTPNFIMPGVAKCGTTTIYHLLEGHPRVTGGIEKEVRFLMDADDELCPSINIRDAGIDAWASLYADGGRGDFDLWMDASPQYQYQQVAQETIAALTDKPRVLFMVRQPSRRLYSLYQYARYHQRRLPHIKSFSQFIDEIREPAGTRLEAQKMLRTAWEDTHYDRAVEVWQSLVPAGKFLVLHIEDLAADRAGTIARLARFLGIDGAPLLQRAGLQSNPTVRTRSRAVRKLGGRAARWLPENALVRNLKDRIKALNEGGLDQGEMVANAQLLAELDDYFSPHLQRLASLQEAHGAGMADA